MKAITTTLYVCGGLMAAAAVMGAVDYSSAARKGTMNKLYKEEVPAIKPTAMPKEIGPEDYSRGEINPPAATEEVKAPVEAAVQKIAAAPVKMKKKKKRVNLKKFSRAALDEEIILADSLAAKQ